ncbi:MAG: TetR family transcriptional regulator [Streptomycetaceae bacterium]|jgi:AcrR family transcriptional regulator|nr:TetR family transcriptional regulator [Streptomycetaceae bacterium]NUS58935.1 TetR family transcriptional regulator [Streptomycetaceae bacterium]
MRPPYDRSADSVNSCRVNWVSDTPTTRAERRRATEARILASARALFAERGFDRTTVRAVAAAAEVDPALVMQYFGSKRDLFTRAVQAAPIPAGADGTGAADPDAVVEQLLTTMGLKLGGLPDGAVALLRSMLTDPAAADHARGTIAEQIAGIAAALGPGPDAELRAAVMIMAMIGVTVGHQLLEVDTLRDASPDRIAAALRPAFRALAGTTDG